MSIIRIFHIYFTLKVNVLNNKKLADEFASQNWQTFLKKVTHSILFFAFYDENFSEIVVSEISSQ